MLHEHNLEYAHIGSKKKRIVGCALKLQVDKSTEWDLRDLNPQPTDYESAALTIELRSQKNVLFVAE